MAIYAVGDIQGCYIELRALLDQAHFNPKHDVLWCCGDLVNRGQDSLSVLRYLKSLGDACVCVLGNHDLQLLACAAGGKSFSGDTLDAVLAADDADALITWLRYRPLLHHDKGLKWTMVHAGLHPHWSLKHAKKRAQELEKVLQSKHWGDFCLSLQQQSLPTQDSQKHRLTFATSVFTRTRFCQQDGIFDWHCKSSDAKRNDLKPWFEHKALAWKADCRIVYGHWAAKGLVTNQKHVLGLDSGCVWGGELTLARLDVAQPSLLSQKCKTQKSAPTHK
ncbi:MAG: symmetrical bis(5'-nucleosyl)-tetraphosphatase [Ghiorsea sp.]